MMTFVPGNSRLYVVQCKKAVETETVSKVGIPGGPVIKTACPNTGVWLRSGN